MAFPAGPYTDGQTYTEGGVTFTYLSAVNGWVITSTGSSGGGGGGGGSIAAPSYHGHFTISVGYSSIPGNATTPTVGPAINVATTWVDTFASPDNAGFSWATSPFDWQGTITQRPNGGIQILNAGKYRVNVIAQVSVFSMQSSTEFRNIALRNSTPILRGTQFHHFEISSAGGSISHTSYVKQEFGGIATFAADDVLCFAVHPGSQTVNNPSFRYIIEIESLF